MKYLEGKKTYVAAVILLFVGAGGYWFGQVPANAALVLVATALGFFGVGSKVERYAQAILESLDELKGLREKNQRGEKVDPVAAAGKLSAIALGAAVGSESKKG